MSKQYNIRWRESDTEELKRTVKNFNAKIDRLAKKDPKNAVNLPEKTSITELKKLIDTRQDLNRELNSLKRFSKRGSEKIVDVPNSDYNLQITKWQKSEMTRRVATINRKRKTRLEEIENTEMTSRGENLGYTRGQLGMGKADEISLQPMKAFNPKMTRHDLKKKHKSIIIQSQSTYFNRKDEQFRQNFISGLEQNFNPKDVKTIITAIEKMSFKDFFSRFQSEGGSFEFIYPPDDEQYQGYLSSLKSTWMPNKSKG